jgi:hypothetical protein
MPGCRGERVAHPAVVTALPGGAILVVALRQDSDLVLRVVDSEVFSRSEDGIAGNGSRRWKS